MSQVESMRGAMRLTRTRPGIKAAFPGWPGLLVARVRARGIAREQEASPKADSIQRYVALRPVMADGPDTRTLPEIDVEEKLKSAFARGWSVIVWNDPVNLMDYVVYVFKTVLKMNEKDASKHMWEVHQRGKSVVARETRERSELIVHRLRGFGLNAPLEQA